MRWKTSYHNWQGSSHDEEDEDVDEEDVVSIPLAFPFLVVFIVLLLCC